MFAQRLHSIYAPGKPGLPRHIFIILTLLALLLNACAAAQATQFPSSGGGLPPVEAPAARAPAGEADYDYAPSEESVSGDNASGAPQQRRIVIKNAELSLIVADPAQSMNNISAMAEEMEGYVVAANLYQRTLDSGRQSPYAQITIRVPAERLDEALQRIRGESGDLPISQSIDSQDVTREYVDLNGRLRNLEATEAQLTEIMEDADTTEDVLAVYQELTRIRGEIESVKGQIQYYEQSAALSAITVRLDTDEANQPLTIGGWEPVGVARTAILSLIDTLQFLVNALIWIILFFLPVAVVLYLVFFLPLRWLWRKLRSARPPRGPYPPASQPPASQPPASQPPQNPAG